MKISAFKQHFAKMVGFIIILSGGGCGNAMPLYDDFSGYGSPGTLLGGHKAPSGENWVIYTNCAESNLNGLNVSLSGYFKNHHDKMTAKLPLGFPGPFVGGHDTSLFSILIPPNKPICSPYSFGLGACLAFSPSIPGSAGQSIFVSFFLDVPQLNFPIGDQTMFNGNSSTYNSWFAGFLNNGSLPHISGLNQCTGPGNFERLVFRCTSTVEDTQNFWTAVGDGFDGRNPFITPGAAYLSGPFNVINAMKAARIYFVVFAYEWGAKGTLGSDSERLWFNPPANTFGADVEPEPREERVASHFTGSIRSANNALTDAAGFFFVTGPGKNNHGKRGVPSGGLIFNSLRIGTNWAYVTGGVQITSHAPSYVVNGSGQTIVLNSTAEAGGVPVSYTWQKDGRVLAARGRFKQGPTGALTISNIDATDAGAYELQASTPITLENDSSVDVGRTALVVDPVITAQPADILAIKGSQAMFSVTATTRNGSLCYRWYKGSTPLTNGPTGHGSSIRNSSTEKLTIENSSAADEGTYIAYITNSSKPFIVAISAGAALKTR